MMPHIGSLNKLANSKINNQEFEEFLRKKKFLSIVRDARRAAESTNPNISIRAAKRLDKFSRAIIVFAKGIGISEEKISGWRGKNIDPSSETDEELLCHTFFYAAFSLVKPFCLQGLSMELAGRRV